MFAACVAEAFAVVAVCATVQTAAVVFVTVQSAVVDGVLDQLVPVDAVFAVVEPSLAAVADAVFVEIVPAGGAFDRPAVALVYVPAQPVLVDGVLDQPVPVVSGTVQSAVADGAFDQFASDAQAVADAPDRSAFDVLVPGVSGQSVSEDLPGAHLTEQVVVLFPVAGPATHHAFFAGLQELFPAPLVFVCLVRWIAGFPDSAVGRASSTCRPVRSPVSFPVPSAVRGTDRVCEHPPALPPVSLWSRSFPS